MSVSFKDRAYQHIRTKLMDGSFEAGQRLSEVVLSTEIGISRTPVREALNRLVSEGLAKQLPHYGVFARGFDRDELEELYDLREMLEGYAAEWAAAKRTEVQLAELREICRQLRDVVRAYRQSGEAKLEGPLAERQAKLDLRFHTVVLEAANRPQTRKVASELRLLGQICGRVRFVPEENVLFILARTLREHTAILRALERHDGEGARTWMSRHLRRGRAEGLAAFDRRAGQESRDSTDHHKDHIDRYQMIARKAEEV